MTHEELRAMLVDAGLGRVADVIVREARPSIRLTAHAVEDEDTLPLGASKLGGSPDLPRSYEWPRYNGFPLAFIAQINLVEATASDIETLLPSSGMLYFFFSHEQYIQAQEWPPPLGLTSVVFFSDGRTSLERIPMPDPLPVEHDCGPYRACSLTFRRETTLPDYLPYLDSSWHSGIRERIGLVAVFGESEREAYSNMRNHLGGEVYNANRMLGHPDPIQGLDLYPEHVLLLQIDSEDELAGMMWGDVGRLYWWMTKDELARRDFSNVRFDEQCT